MKNCMNGQSLIQANFGKRHGNILILFRPLHYHEIVDDITKDALELSGFPEQN
jgi:hypothetical protein